MEVITPKSLTNALKDFRAKGDDRWVGDSELEEKAKAIVDEYLEDSVGHTVTNAEIDELTSYEGTIANGDEVRY